jgi:hypothetical protein
MVTVLTADEILRKGLVLVGYDCRRQVKVSKATNLGRFRAHYGSNPVVYAQIWEDLQITEIPEARIDNKMVDADTFLMCIHFLKCYPTEVEQGGLFTGCEKTMRKWTWFYVSKIQALKQQKVSLLPNVVVASHAERENADHYLLILPACLFHHRLFGLSAGLLEIHLSMTMTTPLSSSRWMGCIVASMNPSTLLYQRTLNITHTSSTKQVLTTSLDFLSSRIGLFG